MPNRNPTKSIHGGPGRNQGRPTNEDRGLAPALIFLGAKVERETLASIDAEAERRGVTRNQVVRERLARTKVQK